MQIVGYITVATMLLSGGWLLWRNRRALRGGLDERFSRQERSAQRLRAYVGIGLLAHGLLIGLSILPHWSTLHERPLGVVGGQGETIAQGQIATNLQQIVHQEQVQRVEQQQRRNITRDSLLQILHEKRDDVAEDEQQARQRAVDSVGLPGGVGHGATAAGSPFGTRIGGELWLYRVKHDGDNWNANPKALPVLLREVQKAFPGLKVSSRQEVISLGELPKHRGASFPTLLFFTGTGAVNANDAEKKNLRDYLLAGGLVVADSSGGNFGQNFRQFIRQVYGAGRIRPIELDHEVFRGDKVLYQLSHGCPIYRAHGRQDDAEGMFDADGRLMVFISPGDMGSAWASVAEGQSRAGVERAFQMGTNLVAWSLNTVHDRREEKKNK